MDLHSRSHGISKRDESPQYEVVLRDMGGKPSALSADSSWPLKAGASREMPAIWLAKASTVIEFQSVISAVSTSSCSTCAVEISDSSGTYFVIGSLHDESPAAIKYRYAVQSLETLPIL